MAPPVPGDPALAPVWYKRPSVIVGGIAGLAALGGLAWWALK